MTFSYWLTKYLNHFLATLEKKYILFQVYLSKRTQVWRQFTLEIHPLRAPLSIQIACVGSSCLVSYRSHFIYVCIYVYRNVYIRILNRSIGTHFPFVHRICDASLPHLAREMSQFQMGFPKRNKNKIKTKCQHIVHANSMGEFLFAESESAKCIWLNHTN